MRKEVQHKSSTHAYHHKQPSNTRSSSKKQHRSKPIRRITHLKLTRNRAAASSASVAHPTVLPTSPPPESKPDIPSLLNLEDYIDDIDLHMSMAD